MGENLLVALSNKVTKSMGSQINGRTHYGLPTNLDGSLNVDHFVPIIFKHLDDTLNQEHFNIENDNRSKSNTESTKFREEGNKLFASKDIDDNLKKALEMYSKSIAHATPGSEEICFAYANRAAVLLKLDRLEECLEDIERAMKFGYPEKSKPKLLIRRAECFAKLATRSLIESKSWLNRVPLKEPSRKYFEEKLKDYPSTLKGADIVDEECLIPEIKSPSKRFPCASDALEINCSSLNGRPNRRIVATRDIDVGEVLIVEKHYSKCVERSRLYAHCFYCLAFTWASIPCDTCKHVIYCSEKCKAEAWAQYHEVECTIIGLLIHSNHNALPKMVTLSVKLLVQMCHEAGGLQKLIRRVEGFNTLTSSNSLLVKDEWHQNFSLESILSMTSIDRSLMPIAKPFLFEGTVMVVCSFFLLASRTKFFGVQYNSLNLFKGFIKKSKALLFAKLLVKLSLISNSRCFKIWEEDSGKRAEKGFVLSPFVSLVSHSCLSNVDFQCKRNYLVFHSISPIKKGEEISFSLVESWFVHRREVRHELLRNTFGFVCSCRACREDWPAMDGTISSDFQILSKTQSPLQRAEIEKIFFPLNSMSNKILDGNLKDKDQMLQSLHAMLRYIYDNNFVPCFELALIQRLLNRVYRITGNSAKIQKKFARK